MAGPLLARILPMSVRLSFRERSFRFAIAILGLYRTIRRSTDCPRHMANQIARAGTAIGANLEEANLRTHDANLRRKTASPFGKHASVSTGCACCKSISPNWKR